jgi:glycosyltransferase involved in cell wall biosynthesis
MKSRFEIDKICSLWHSNAKSIVAISGWFHTQQGYPATALRICIGGRKVECQQTVRGDLMGISQDNPIKDARVGFMANFSTKPGLKWLRFEFLSTKNEWVPFARRLVWVKTVVPLVSVNPAPCAQITPHHIPPASKREECIDRVHPGIKRVPISIVMPTYNRAETLAEVVRATQKLCANFDFEWIIIDDGSTDQTPVVLESLVKEVPSLRYKSIKNGGPGNARNVGAQLARFEVVLFMGDDILPANEDFLRAHAEFHAQYTSPQFAVLGKVVWPCNQKLSVSPVMRHIQGRGGEQFGYADFTPNSFYDWRFFYTCNVSLKKGAVEDWLNDGFSDKFRFAAFEDAELAYRLQKRLGAFQIYYTPSSSACHLHAYSTTSFLRRQEYAGAMANTFAELHPEVLSLIGVAEVRDAMLEPSPITSVDLTSDYLTVIEGIKAWARVLEHEGQLGNEAWHEELLFAIFEIAYLQGYVINASSGAANYAKAYSHILSRAKIRLGRILDTEVSNDVRFKAAILALS